MIREEYGAKWALLGTENGTVLISARLCIFQCSMMPLCCCYCTFIRNSITSASVSLLELKSRLNHMEWAAGKSGGKVFFRRHFYFFSGFKEAFNCIPYINGQFTWNASCAAFGTDKGWYVFYIGIKAFPLKMESGFLKFHRWMTFGARFIFYHNHLFRIWKFIHMLLSGIYAVTISISSSQE